MRKHKEQIALALIVIGIASIVYYRIIFAPDFTRPNSYFQAMPPS